MSQEEYGVLWLISVWDRARSILQQIIRLLVVLNISVIQCR